jgi:hypothetical protein
MPAWSLYLYELHLISISNTIIIGNIIMYFNCEKFLNNIPIIVCVKFYLAL